MNSGIIIVIGILFLAILGIAIYFYISVEKPKENEANNINYINLSIFAIDANNKNIISTKIIVRDSNNNTQFKSYSTKDYATLVQVVSNNSYTIYNEYTNQSYYSDVVIKNYSNENVPQRIILSLRKAGELNITPINNKLNKLGGNVVLNITSKNTFKNLDFCIKWSPHIITVKPTQNFNEITKLSNYSAYDRCYSSNKSLVFNDDFFILDLEYKVFQTIDNRDYIRIALYDNNCVLDNCYAFVNGVDIGAKNTIYEINNI